MPKCGKCGRHYGGNSCLHGVAQKTKAVKAENAKLKKTPDKPKE